MSIAQRDLVTIARDAAQDIHPPLYYWILHGWLRLLGTGEEAVRSLSAMLGVVLVALTYALGRKLAGRGVGLAGALLASVHPFQVYYAQETRMYMLLAVLTAGAVLALIHVVEPQSALRFLSVVALVLLETAGLYTHYSFVFVVCVLNLSFALWLAVSWRQSRAPWHFLKRWGGSQLCVLLLYLPWLPTAIRQMTTWPSPELSAAWLPALADTWRWLVFGPTIETARVVVSLSAAALLLVVGLLSWGTGRRRPQASWGHWPAGTLALWIGLPVILMFALGLYREAYLKFLLVTTPAIAILLGGGLLVTPSPARWGRTRTQAASAAREAEGIAGTAACTRGNASRRASQVSRLALYVLRLGQFLAIVSVLVASAVALRNVYANPTYARDNYRDIAAYVDAVGRAGDTILLNAPGQQEVFCYYYGALTGDLPIYPLPGSRPLAAEATEAALTELAQSGGRVFAILWATNESDPERFIEGWLDSHTYKALDSWYGNVRLAVYAVPEETPVSPSHRLDIPLKDPVTGDRITLQGYSRLNDRLSAGDIAQITLFWEAERTPTQRYKVFLHVLDGGDQIVGQRDAEPGGGARLTTLWTPGETITDNYGVPIHPATPPGEYRIEMGMYNLDTGQRLLAPDGTGEIWLEPIWVDRAATGAPVAALGMQHSTDAVLGELTLLGYDAHRLGFGYQSDTALRPGDVMHLVLYWRAERQPTGEWQIAIDLTGPDDRVSAGITGDPAEGYPTNKWQAGDVWRGLFNLTIPRTVTPGRYRLRIRLLAPDGNPVSEAFFSEPIPIRP